MTYKKQEWFDIKRNGLMFELTVRDQDWKKLEVKKFTLKDFTNTIKDIGKRYGINKSMLNPSKEIEDELEWLRKEKII